MNQLLLGAAVKKIGDLLEECKSQCINLKHITFEEKIDKWKYYYLQISLINAGLRHITNDDNALQEIRKDIFTQLINLYTGLFISDFVLFKNRAENENIEYNLNILLENKIWLINAEFINILNAFEITREILTLQKFPSEINFEVLFLSSELPKSIKYIESRLKEINSQKFYEVSINERSEQAFNLAFYILNSQNLWHVPSKSVFKTNEEFKTDYFPTYKPLNENYYRVAIFFFDMALKYDPQNVAASILKEITVLEKCMSDREFNHFNFIDNLKQIILENPNNGLPKVELAYAFCCIGKQDEAIKLIELALNDSPKSSYVRYRAFKIYLDYFNHEEEKRKELLNDAILIDPENPIFYYHRALYYFNKEEFHFACMDVDKAIDALGCITHKEFIWLRIQIYDSVLKYYPGTFLKGHAEKQDAKNNQILNVIHHLENKFKNDYNLKVFKSLRFSEIEFNVIFITETDGVPTKKETFKSIIFLDFCYQYIPSTNRKLIFFLRLPDELTRGRYVLNDGNLILSGLNLNEFLV